VENGIILDDEARKQAIEEEKKRRRKNHIKRVAKDTIGGWLFVLPAVILMAVFTFYPIVMSFISAFMEHYEKGNITQNITIGFDNFRAVILDDTGTTGMKFLTALDNTLFFAIVSVPISTLLALLIAVALNSIKAVQKAYQTVLFLPYLTNALSMGAVFATFFDVIGTKKEREVLGTASYGLVNDIIRAFGGQWQMWLSTGNPWGNRLVVVIYSIWAGLPFKILILFSALQNVNKQYYDAAKIDGASKNTTLWRITVPLISPMLSYLLVTGMMGGLKVYSSIIGIFGQDMNSGEMGTMVGYVYDCINLQQTGYAAAGSLILFGIIMIFTAINMYVSKKKVHY
jgi:multiple sugar transport system permease protein